jgi:hypothetical protein
MKFIICEVEPYFDEDFGGTLNRVKRVLYICDSIEEAEHAFLIFDATRYNDFDTCIRIVPEDQLDDNFR